MKTVNFQAVDSKDYRPEDWVRFPGGELEGKRPKVLCRMCRAAIQAGKSPARQPLCFQCYRADVERDRALKAAGELNTASEARFQSALPFEPVNLPRLQMLKMERADVRQASKDGAGRFEDKRRQAQLAARHALQRIAAGLALRYPARADHLRQMSAAIHAAELQLPESWLPFVVAR